MEVLRGVRGNPVAGEAIDGKVIDRYATRLDLQSVDSRPRRRAIQLHRADTAFVAAGNADRFGDGRQRRSWGDRHGAPGMSKSISSTALSSDSPAGASPEGALVLAAVIASRSVTTPSLAMVSPMPVT